MFWQDLDAAHARHALSVQLHQIRRALGRDALVTVGDTVRLNPDVLAVDVLQFVEALQRGDLEPGLALYRGPFLEGFHLTGCVEFEHWVDTQRQRLASRYSDALESLATREERAGHPAAAVSWWLRASHHDPFNSRLALACARALAASGDRGNGVQFLRDHVARLRLDLEIEPDQAILEAIRTGDLGVIPGYGKGNGSPPADLLPSGPPAGSHSPGPVDHTAATPAQTSTRLAPGRWWRRRAPLAATIVLVAMGGLTVIRAGRARTSDGTRITVLPTETVGLDSTMSTLVTSYLRAALADWDNLDAASLRASAEGQNGNGVVVGVSDHTRQIISRSERGLLLTSRAMPAPDGIVLHAELADAVSGVPLAAASVTAPTEGIRAAAAHLLVHVIADAMRVPDDRVATLDGHDPLAVRSYLMGSHAGPEERTRRLREALGRDSTFALAAMGLLDEVFDDVWRIREPPWTAVAATAWRHRDHLSPADRAYVEALVGWLFTPDYSAALHVEMWERAVLTGPDRLPNLRGYALECYRWCSEVVSDWQERVLQAQDALLAAGDSSVEFLERGLEVALLAQDTMRLRRYAQPLPESAQYGHWLAAIGLDSGPEAKQLSRAIRAGEVTDYRIGNVAVLTGLGLEDAETIAQWDMNSGRIHQLRALVQARERGRHTEYRMLRDRMFQLVATTTRYDVFLSHLIIWEWAFFGEPETDSMLDAHEAVLSAIIERVPRAGPDTLATAHCALAQLRLGRGETTGVDDAVTFLAHDAAARDLPVSRMCAPLLDLLAARDSNPEAVVRVVRRLSDIMRHRPLEIGNGAGMVNVEIMLAGAANLELARAMLRLGYPEAGLRVVGRRPYRAGLWGLFGYHVDFLLVEARLLAAAGASAEALAKYDLYFRLRPEPPDLATWRQTWETARAEHRDLLSAAAGDMDARASDG
jgi:hypothetical protein